MGDFEYEDVLKKLNKRSRNSGIIYAFIPLVIISVVLLVFWSRLEKRDNLLKEKSAELMIKEQSLDSLENYLQMQKDSLIFAREMNGQNEAIIIQYNAEVNDFANSIKDTSSLIYQQIQQTNFAIDEIEKIEDESSFGKIAQIIYYKQDADENRVLDALTEIGVEKSNIRIESIKNTKEYKDYGPSNYIEYGRNVDTKFLKVLLLHLLKQGMDIKSVEPLLADNGTGNEIYIMRNSFIQKSMVITPKNVVFGFDSLIQIKQ